MKNRTPDFPPSALDFPPLTSTQKSLLKEIKSLKEKLETLPLWDPKTGTWVPEFYEIHEKIDEDTIRALRSGMLKSLPAESRHPGRRFVFDSQGEYAKVLPGAGDFHPELPPWAENHFIEWIQAQRLRKDGRESLRKTKIVGLETGMRPPKNITLLKRVLELRGFEFEEDEDPEAEMLEKSGKRTRTKKDRQSWKNHVIPQLVKEGFFPKEISPQALKKQLKRHYPYVPWDQV
ncbi:MAG: hypothetical protein AB1491_01360 [Thermodesulfobacteriota bacterium]